jgi:large subunit ribosomal protein L25
MKLNVKPREGDKKSDIKKIRREGNIPAIIYSLKSQPKKIVLEGEEFNAVLRKLKPGHLPTQVFILVDGKAERRVVIKDIQYHLTTYNVSHIDFSELFEDSLVSVKVPVTCVGVADCVGVKLGGFLRQVMRHVKVECLPKEIPADFSVDVKDLGIRQTRRLKDIQIPEGVRPLVNMEEVIVVIAKR